MFEDYDDEEKVNEPLEAEEGGDFASFESDEEAAAGSSNRAFIYAAIGLGTLIILALICLIAYVLMNRDNGGQADRDQRSTENAMAFAQQTEIAFAQAATEAALAFTSTPTVTPSPLATATDRPVTTNTPVVVLMTNTPGAEATDDPRMVTLTALYAQLTESALTPLAPTTTALSATALPDTGFFDDIGMPALLMLAGLAIVLIFLVRRLRAATG